MMVTWSKVNFLSGAAVLALSAAATGLAVPAMAQGTQNGDAIGDEEQAGAAPAPDSVIVVTARRREESLQETPVAISAFSAETLQDRQIQQTSDLERITPSLQFKPAGQLSGNSESLPCCFSRDARNSGDFALHKEEALPLKAPKFCIRCTSRTPVPRHVFSLKKLFWRSKG